MNVDNRKGELAELKSQLGLLAGSRAPGVADLKRELFKKVISFMTIGIDVSSIFSEMVMCSATADLVLKKMCYLYVCNYAVMKPELALLTINFLQRDCQDDNPMVRGLALRSLCSLRVKNLVEYLLPQLEKGLRDSSAYVRSNAVMGVLKLYHIAPLACKEHEFIDSLKAKLIDDHDPQVVANSLCCLQEILTIESSLPDGMRERDILYSKPLIYSLLNRLRDLSEWAQCLVLDLVSQYIPESAEESFDMMDLLEDRLQHANSAVVLATVKVFLHLTTAMPDVHQQVYERAKTPLLTLIGTCDPETSFCVLSHLSLLVSRAPKLFAGDYKHFYCRFSDPPYVKKLKLQMLTAVANESSMFDIVSELSEYAADVDVGIAREAIRAVGQIALKSLDVNGIVDRLLQFLEMDTDYVTAETLVLVKDLLRKYPQWSADCIAVVGSVSSRSVTEPRAKAALIWLLGEYGNDMADAPYILEGLMEGWKEEESPEVRLELLTAAAKLFFKRPPECQAILGTALLQGVADTNQDVHDRALLYYRLLKAGVSTAKSTIDPPKQAVSVFVDAQSSEVKDRIFDEFNSLSVVYGKPSYLFLDKEIRALQSAEPPLATPALAAPPSATSFSQNDRLLTSSELDEVSYRPSSSSSASSSAHYMTNGAVPATSRAAAPAAAPPAVDLLSFAAEPHPTPATDSLSASPFDSFTPSSVAFTTTPVAPSLVEPSGAAPSSLDSALGALTNSGPTSGSASLPATASSQSATLTSASSPLDDLLGLSSSLPASQPSPAAAADLLLQLQQRPVLDAASFQRKWGALPIALTLEESLSTSFVSALTTPQPLLRHMALSNIQCMASGGQPPNFKFFFYSQLQGASPGSGMFLVELVVNTSTAKAVAKVKVEEEELAAEFATLFKSALHSLS